MNFAHFCQDEHEPIGHNDSEHERCPLCRARDALSAIDEIWYEDAGKHSRPSQTAVNKMLDVFAHYWGETSPKDSGTNAS